VIVKAQAGVGKTTAIAISVLQRIDEAKKQPQAIILAPFLGAAQQVRR
jgi:ATP-dependent RNA helicase DeaD